MKVAFDHQIFTLQSYGGVSRYYSILSTEFIRKNIDVRIFAGLHRNHYLHDLPPSMVQGTKLSGYPPKTVRAFQLFNHGFSQARATIWKPDVIHETYYSSLPRLRTNAALITTVYDMIHELFHEEFSSRDKTSALKEATFKRVDHILSISDSTKRDLISLFGVPEEKISVVHLGVDLATFQIEKTNNPFQSKPYLLYVGGRVGYKNFSGFLRAVASSPQLKSDFDVVAFGGGAIKPDELQLIKELGLYETQVHQVSGNDQLLARLYAHAEAFVYPSLYEGFGLPPLEAMAAGCPVVTSNTSSMPEVVRQAGEYFDPTEVADIQQAIERVVFSSQHRADLVRLGYENIKHFSWTRCAEETLKVYQKITGIA